MDSTSPDEMLMSANFDEWQWSTAGQEDDVSDFGMELKIHEVERIASLVDEKKLTRREAYPSSTRSSTP